MWSHVAFPVYHPIGRLPLGEGIETHEEPLFLSAASLVELEAVIDRVRGRDTKRAEALQAWLDGLVTTFSDRIQLYFRPWEITSICAPVLEPMLSTERREVGR
jgi:hypothetical protein